MKHTFSLVVTSQARGPEQVADLARDIRHVLEEAMDDEAIEASLKLIMLVSSEEQG